ncbi:ATP-binding protein [Dokdonella sp.]|uniref:ATP-binding protein n=1 Tax=Dokdonella sp. TaxID=2291710 RepID=UPI00261C91FD|nr:ATP-binding protein [Dokdonella sp.]
MPTPTSRSRQAGYRLLEWLRRVPVEDPVERRNAPMLQGILLAFGLVVPMTAVLRWSQHLPIGEIDVGGELLGLARIGFAWIAFYLVRLGYFRFAAGLFIASELTGLAFAYAVYGLKAQLPMQVVHAFPLVLGGLLLGRRALWWIAAALLAIATAGAAHDFQTGLLPFLRVEAWSNLLAVLLGFGGIAIVLDRAVSALRESLGTATRRGQELVRARDRLEREVVERERTQAQLTHALKMEAIGRIASGIAHDFNNILAVVLGYASRPGAAADTETAEKSLNGIRAAARRGALVAQRLLNLGRNDAARVERTDVATVVEAMQPLLAQVFDGRVRVTLSIARRPLPVRIDRGGLELALLNIATNARDAMPDGGGFDIRASLRDGSEGRQVLLTLSDTGAGMPAEVAARMFEPFYTTKPRGAGTGLGLSDVRRLVAETGGSIEVDSTPGDGTTLRIALPSAEPATDAAIALPSGVRVLLVDDDDALRDVLAGALRDAGAEVVEARGGDEAERHAVAGVEAIVTDFELPDVCADELLPRLLTGRPPVPVVLISAHAYAHERCAATVPSLASLRKPFATADLVDALARHLRA